jgi:DNA-binding GntR family transcriptional regulator
VDRLDPDDPQPAYQQVAAVLRAQLQSGVPAPGDKLPSHAQLVEDYGVSLGTIKRALGVLQSEGLIVSRRGEGAFVRSRPPEQSVANRADDSQLQAKIADLTKRVEDLERRVNARP